MRNLFICFLGFVMLFSGIGLPSYAAKPAPKKTEQKLQTDSGRVDVRHFDAKALQRYSVDKEFQYGESQKQTLSLWDRFWNWVWYVIRNVLNKINFGKTSWVVFKWVLLILSVAFLIYAILKIFGIDVLNMFQGKSKTLEIAYTESLENIHEINFDTEIENAVSNRNYRLAVRLLYLRSLKQLNDAQLIHWQIEKTNAHYLNELADTEQRQLFSLLTTRFEYVWYGDFPIDSQSFTNINTLFIDFKRKLS